MIAPVLLISNWPLPPGGSGLKTLFKAQWLRYKPLQNVLLIRQSALADCAFSYVTPHDASGVSRPRVGGITHLIVLIKVCLLPLTLIYDFETTSRQKLLLVFGTVDVVCGKQ